MNSLTRQAEAALTRLYKQAARTTDIFALERIDRALDEIVRLNGTEPPAYQVRSAMANALKVLRDRRRLAPHVDGQGAEPSEPDPNQAVIDLRLWLRDTQRITGPQRRVLNLLANDYDADTIAALNETPVKQVRERISRARRAARTAHDLEMLAA